MISREEGGEVLALNMGLSQIGVIPPPSP